MENKKLIYERKHPSLNIQCFKLLDIDELTDNTYEIIGTNPYTNEVVELTTNTPQGAVALADNVINSLNERIC